MWPVFANQNAERPVSTAPLPGMGVGCTTSYGEMRSLATMRMRSPISYISRTLPLAIRGKSATVDINRRLAAVPAAQPAPSGRADASSKGPANGRFSRSDSSAPGPPPPARRLHRPGRGLRPDAPAGQVRRALRQRDRGRVRVPAGDARHHRGVDDTQGLDAAHPQLGVEDRAVVG